MLKTLPLERRQEIALHGAQHTIDETLAWLRDQKITTSKSALSEFLSWQALEQTFIDDGQTVEQVLRELRKKSDLTEKQLEALGQRTFSLLAIRRQDPRAWHLVRQISIKRSELGLAQKKFQRDTCALFLQWLEDRRAREIASGAGSNADKIEKLGQLMFGEDWQ